MKVHLSVTWFENRLISPPSRIEVELNQKQELMKCNNGFATALPLMSKKDKNTSEVIGSTCGLFLHR